MSTATKKPPPKKRNSAKKRVILKAPKVGKISRAKARKAVQKISTSYKDILTKKKV